MTGHLTRGPMLALVVGGSLVAAAPALADFVTPDAYGWTRGAAGSTHFQWESFSSTTGPNAPDAAAFPSPLPAGWASPNVVDASTGGLITGSGNIYNMGSPISITATAPSYGLGDGPVTRVVVQVRTQGTEIDPASVSVNGVAPTLAQELSRQPMGGFGGFIVEVLYTFDLPGNAEVYAVRFDAAVGSMSLDRLSIDTAALDGACAADWSGDGTVNSSDISAFLTGWLASVTAPDLTADFNGDGVTNSSDISSFLTAWLDAVANGC